MSPEWMENQGMVIDIYHPISDTNVSFKLYLNDFSDNYTQNWDEDVTVGRNDPHELFINTTRSISVGLTIPTDGIEDAVRAFTDISTLTRMQYPLFGNTSSKKKDLFVIKGAPVFKVKMLNWITDASAGSGVKSTAKESGLYCIMKDGFSFQPNIDAGVYHDEDGEFGEAGCIYPREFSVELKLNILHRHNLGFTTSKGEVRFRQEGYPYGRNSEQLDFTNDTSAFSEVQNSLTNKILGGK